MFNIHQMREPWRDIPTARALDELVGAIKNETGSDPSNRMLAEKTGLSVERIRRLRYASELPTEYQDYISDGTIPLNWFWELHRNVVQPLAEKRRELYDKYGIEGVLNGFVQKRLNGVITDTVSLRDVRPIINFAARDAEDSGAGSSILDETIEKLITDDELTIADAYGDTVQIMVESDQLQRRTQNMVKGFDRLFARTRNAEERQVVLDIAIHLRGELDRLIEENQT